MHPIELLISKADTAINQEDFETLLDIYSDDAVLVVKPGMNAVGKEQIKKAFEAIAAHFEHSLEVKQAGMAILETGDTALVLARTVVSAKNLPPAERKATYVFKRSSENRWVCAIDNSYGHSLLEADA
ncbi:MAG TPA: SgcJ/EcaC family oxidoreductase [Casimicrobiaceae bacterium]|nr:SgcJ/EcaC family oxidoreductase [Casimicrobiaceae bacterium]